MNIKLERDEIVDFFLLYIRDIIILDDEKESSRIIRKSNIQKQLRPIFESKVDSNTVLKYNQFKTSLKDNIRILS